MHHFRGNRPYIYIYIYPFQNDIAFVIPIIANIALMSIISVCLCVLRIQKQFVCVSSYPNSIVFNASKTVTLCFCCV